MRSYWIVVGRHPVGLSRKNRQIHKEDGHVKTKANSGVLMARIKENPVLPEAGRGKKGSFLSSFAGAHDPAATLTPLPGL